MQVREIDYLKDRYKAIKAECEYCANCKELSQIKGYEDVCQTHMKRLDYIAERMFEII